ncbi:MMPL family transporter [Kineosporia sp. NBRC 101731]|uniref:MMPL family transporter n=1 Tax=Kineosporia sp. NBRC 101731 TaxID=3032199 RepID=UPI0024A3CC6E|nr:MMPL family transporter [Kineosporia sp. NBRC 101731]GLY29757.1 membrane protein [Kineosporia sp. NBRC 101731]
MAWHLFRLGRWAFVHRRLVTATWLAIFAATIAGMLTLAGETSDAFELDGLESTQAFELIEARTPNVNPEAAGAQIVFQAPAGQRLDTQAGRAAVTDALAAVRTDHVDSATNPFTTGTVSPDGTVAYAAVDYTVSALELTETDRQALARAKDIAGQAGLQAYVGGDAAEESSEPPLGELIGVGVAFVVLTITFGSLVAAGMPLLTAVIGVGIGVTAIGTLSGFVELGSTTPALGVMLGLAVGIDYALFIMSRYQHEVRQGHDLPEAAGRAVGTAGSAVIFAGATVVIALAGLSVCGIGFLTQLGLAGAGMVALSVLIALTLLPALLGFAGQRVTAGRLRFLKSRDPEGDTERTNGLRWVEAVARRRWPVLVAGVAAAAVIAVPVFSMQLALPGPATDPAGSDTRVAYDLISENFGEGVNGPLVVVVDTEKAADPVGAVQTAVTQLNSIGTGVASVVSPLAGTGKKARAALAQQLDAVGFAAVTVIPASGPTDAATKDLVTTIRAALAGLPAETGARALVTGQTAVGVDIADELNRVFPLYLAVVVGLAFILLVLVFRSILVPLKAAVGFLLSVGVSLGATVAVFQWGWLGELLGLDTTSPVLFLLPLLLTGILFGLAMDYEVFLVTRMREAYVHGADAHQAVVEGFRHSARVVTAAAVIMIGVFAGFSLVDDFTLKTIGFALAVGVLADAFLVRMTIVPAVMFIIGRRIWWIPRRLDQILPDLDIEGESLMRRQEAADSAADLEEPVTQH